MKIDVPNADFDFKELKFNRTGITWRNLRSMASYSVCGIELTAS